MALVKHDGNSLPSQVASDNTLDDWRLLIPLNYVEHVASNQTISMPSLNSDYFLKGSLIGDFNSKTSEEFLDRKRCQIIHIVNDLLVVLIVEP